MEINVCKNATARTLTVTLPTANASVLLGSKERTVMNPVTLDSLEPDAVDSVIARTMPPVTRTWDPVLASLDGEDLDGKCSVHNDNILFIFSDRPCPDGHWGEKCAFKCNCKTGG